MGDKSRDLTATEAINKIKAMDKAGEVKKFAKGDSRKTVADAADKRIDTIKAEKKGGKKKEAKAEAKTEKKKKKTPSR